MYVEQLYTGCLAEAAYYIESNGEAAIIDPLRETFPYTDLAEKRGAKIKYVFETHFHADFVSGHVDLAQKTGATIVYGPTASAGFKMHVGKDNEEFKIGDVKIKLLHTPGHTPESSTYLLIDEHGENHAIFTGDTLFLGDVGRPDLAIKSDVTEKDLAGMLFDSLRNKLMPLADEVIVYPGHGAGSACGKNMSKETVGTLGEQKRINYALRANMTKEEFIAEVLHGILPPPQYFAKNAMMNKSGYKSIDDVMAAGLNPMTIEQFEKEMNGAIIIDTRTQNEFKDGFIPSSIFIGLNGQFAVWVGALITNLNQKILLVTDEGKEEESVLRLARVGYDNCVGYLKGGFKTWAAAGKPVETITSISAKELEQIALSKDVKIIDVRKTTEFLSERLEQAESFPLDSINNWLNKLDKNETKYLHCAGGYRSMIATSILRKEGYRNIIDVAGGANAIFNNTTLKKTAYVCPSTL